MAIDSRKMIERVTRSEVKKNYTIALTPSVMEDFKTECEKKSVKYSPIIEELIKEFLESSKKNK